MKQFMKMIECLLLKRNKISTNLVEIWHTDTYFISQKKKNDYSLVMVIVNTLRWNSMLLI